MRPVLWVLLGLALSGIGPRASAQLPDSPQPALDKSLTEYEALDAHSYVTTPIDSEPIGASAESAGLVQNAPAPTRRVADTKFFLWNGVHLGMAILDVEMTQRCISSHHCREANPVMPSSQTGQLTVNFAIFAYTTGLSYWLKRRQSGYWWLPPAAGTAVHTIGVASGFDHQ